MTLPDMNTNIIFIWSCCFSNKNSVEMTGYFYCHVFQCHSDASWLRNDFLKLLLIAWKRKETITLAKFSSAVQWGFVTFEAVLVLQTCRSCQMAAAFNAEISHDLKISLLFAVIFFLIDILLIIVISHQFFIYVLNFRLQSQNLTKLNAGFSGAGQKEHFSRTLHGVRPKLNGTSLSHRCGRLCKYLTWPIGRPVENLANEVNRTQAGRKCRNDVKEHTGSDSIGSGVWGESQPQQKFPILFALICLSFCGKQIFRSCSHDFAWWWQ